MKRPLTDKRPIGPFSQMTPSDNDIPLEFILSNPVFKAQMQQKGRIQIPVSDAQRADIDGGDVIKIRLFPIDDDSLSIQNRLQTIGFTDILEQDNQALFGAIVQTNRRITIPKGTVEMLDLEVGDKVLVLIEKV